MSIPHYQLSMLPLLKFGSDGKEYLLPEAIEHLVDYFTEE